MEPVALAKGSRRCASWLGSSSVFSPPGTGSTGFSSNLTRCVVAVAVSCADCSRRRQDGLSMTSAPSTNCEPLRNASENRSQVHQGLDASRTAMPAPHSPLPGRYASPIPLHRYSARTAADEPAVRSANVGSHSEPARAVPKRGRLGDVVSTSSGAAGPTRLSKPAGIQFHATGDTGGELIRLKERWSKAWRADFDVDHPATSLVFSFISAM